MDSKDHYKGRRRRGVPKGIEIQTTCSAKYLQLNNDEQNSSARL